MTLWKLNQEIKNNNEVLDVSYTEWVWELGNDISLHRCALELKGTWAPCKSHLPFTDWAD